MDQVDGASLALPERQEQKHDREQAEDGPEPPAPPDGGDRERAGQARGIDRQDDRLGMADRTHSLLDRVSNAANVGEILAGAAVVGPAVSVPLIHIGVVRQARVERRGPVAVPFAGPLLVSGRVVLRVRERPVGCGKNLGQLSGRR